MKVEIFDIENGVYLTRLDTIKADYHSHPAMEIVVAEKGDFTLSIDNIDYRDLKLAIIGANISHKISFEKSDIRILILEQRDQLVKNFINGQGVKLERGHFLTQENKWLHIIDNIIKHINQTPFQSEYDTRVKEAVDIIQNHQSGYFELKNALNKRIYLSESRLSHLFKEDTGVSIKKYFVWCRLKVAIQTHLRTNQSLFSSLIEVGFYDQPHFNKIYKSLIGTSPAKTYNSRMIQE